MQIWLSVCSSFILVCNRIEMVYPKEVAIVDASSNVEEIYETARPSLPNLHIDMMLN